MPDKATIERAKRKAREGKSPSTQAGEFVRDQNVHAARFTAIGPFRGLALIDITA